MIKRPDVRAAEALLARIPRARGDQRRRLLLAAAVTKLMSSTPIVVGGTAQAHWAGGAYHATDLDLCPRLAPEDVAALKSAGLRKSGRHWVRDDLPVAVEFPGSGHDIERTVAITVDGVSVLMIGCEDLYLDRVRQATAGWPREDLSFDSALEIALTNYRSIDWDYVARRIAAAGEVEPTVGETMRHVNRRVRLRARRSSVLLANSLT